jgi:pyruvate,water dikinase
VPSEAWFLDDEPNARFPVYCRGNVGEIVPGVSTPLTSTITTPAFRLAFTELFRGTGAFTASELAGPAATGGLFGGYLYFNASFARTLASRVPGMRVADVDHQLLGAMHGDVPEHRPGPGDRSPVTFLRAAVGMGRAVVRRRPTDLDGPRTETQQWIRSLPGEPTHDQVVEMAVAHTQRFTAHLRTHLEASLGAGVPVAVLERLAGRAERAEPGLLVRAMSGLGTIETAGPAVALWRVGRMVAASDELGREFDGGVRGLLARLADSATEDARRFHTAFEDFLRQHGHRGPNEVELASDTWATAPESALAAIERLRFTPESADPERAVLRLAGERDLARARLRRRVPRPLRRLVDRLLDSAATGAANREQAKGTLVLGLSGLRTALFHAADRLVAAGELPDRTDLFMATIDELPDLLEHPGTLVAVLAERRRRYDELNALAPPFSFEGRIPDPSTWPRRDAPAPPAAAREPGTSDELVGIGVAAGVATGTARIVLDAGDPRGLSAGDVLVAPITDPAWTPLFLAACAVVVDVGALQSHAAIVARELGIPAVVSVEGATARIADGDEIEVDGNRGIVHVLKRAAAAPLAR